ncbi:MAG: ABC transporter ATP-binding protein [Deltaproteobacteria bacterium]|nr:ABC transporter ATP-binding protein [Deltaproteobacteria bacterium]
MAQITLKNICKKFGEQVILDDFSLEVRDEEFLVLVGPSGCGKSTTLRIISGLEEPSSGKIFIGEHCVNSTDPKDRDVAMVFQNYALYPHYSVFDNIAFGLKLRKVPKEEIRQKVLKVAELLELSKFLNTKPKFLSGGQRQRVALGRAIVRNPKVFLMDEPLSNLDARLRVQMRAELLKLQRSLQTTTLYVTHDQVEAMTMGDRIVVLDKGKIQQVGTPEEIYHKPENKFVAGFMGSPPMNFLERGSVTLGVRPEKISFQPEGASLELFELSAQFQMTEPLGSEYLHHVIVGGSPWVIRSPKPCSKSMGEALRLLIYKEDIYVFDETRAGRLIEVDAPVDLKKAA